MSKTVKKTIKTVSKPDQWAHLKVSRIPHAEDCWLIRRIFESLGLEVTMKQCNELWSAYSKTQEGSPEWLKLPTTYEGLKSKLIHNVLPDIVGIELEEEI